MSNSSRIVNSSFSAFAVALFTTMALVNVTPAFAAQTLMVGLVTHVVNAAFGTPPATPREKKFVRFPIVSDEVLETDGNSGIVVEFLDETTLTLGSESRLIVDTMVYDPNSRNGKTILRLTTGVFRYVSGLSINHDVQIFTPVVEIGVRGSDALISVASDGATTVNVYSGEFTITRLNTPDLVVVNAAQVVTISGAGDFGAIEQGSTVVPTEMDVSASKEDPGFGLSKSVNIESFSGGGGGRTRNTRAPSVAPPRIAPVTVPRISSPSGHY